MIKKPAVKKSTTTQFDAKTSVSIGDLIKVDYMDEPCYAIALSDSPKRRGIRSKAGGDQHRTINILCVPHVKRSRTLWLRGVTDTNGATYEYVGDGSPVAVPRRGKGSNKGFQNNVVDQLRELNQLIDSVSQA